MPNSKGRLARATASATSSGEDSTIVVKGIGRPRGGPPPFGPPDAVPSPVPAGTPPPAPPAAAGDAGAEAVGVGTTEGSDGSDVEIGGDGSTGRGVATTGRGVLPGVGRGSGMGRPIRTAATAGNTETE
jgi:hypothetical protein